LQRNTPILLFRLIIQLEEKKLCHWLNKQQN